MSISEYKMKDNYSFLCVSENEYVPATDKGNKKKMSPTLFVYLALAEGNRRRRILRTSLLERKRYSPLWIASCFLFLPSWQMITDLFFHRHHNLLVQRA